MNTFNTKSDMPTEAHQIMIKEIHVKWGKFSDQELSALKGRDDLVDQVVAKYGLEKGQAQRDVDALLKGRQL
jgi:uncharacterized protein YjbJ (UPF0337 family)